MQIQSGRTVHLMQQKSDMENVHAIFFVAILKANEEKFRIPVKAPNFDSVS
jgi:hypothetical protein